MIFLALLSIPPVNVRIWEAGILGVTTDNMNDRLSPPYNGGSQCESQSILEPPHSPHTATHTPWTLRL